VRSSFHEILNLLKERFKELIDVLLLLYVDLIAICIFKRADDLAWTSELLMAEHQLCKEAIQSCKDCGIVAIRLQDNLTKGAYHEELLQEADNVTDIVWVLETDIACFAFICCDILSAFFLNFNIALDHCR